MCVAWPTKGRLNWQQLPVWPPASASASAVPSWQMAKILGQLSLQLPPSSEHASDDDSAIRCPGQKLNTLGTQPGDLCVLLWINWFCFLFAMFLYACVCVIVNFLWVIAAIVWLLSVPTLGPFVFLFYQWFMRRIWRCVTRSHKRTHTHTLAYTVAYTHSNTVAHTHRYKVEHAKRWQRRHESTYVCFMGPPTHSFSHTCFFFLFFTSGQALSWHFELLRPFELTNTHLRIHNNTNSAHTHTQHSPANWSSV